VELRRGQRSLLGGGGERLAMLGPGDQRAGRDELFGAG
jgi:hypothetical protein